MILKDSIISSAIEEAKKSDFKQRLGAVIFDKKKIISLGHNYGCRSAKKLHPRFQAFKGSIHAEVDAIIKAKTDLKGYSLLVVRINNKDQFQLAKPCQHCLRYINHVELRKIYYSINSYPYIQELEW